MDGGSTFTAEQICRFVPNLNNAQLDVCIKSPQSMSVLAGTDSRRIFNEECQHQFRNERWNCSGSVPPFLGESSRDLIRGTVQTVVWWSKSSMAGGMIFIDFFSNIQQARRKRLSMHWLQQQLFMQSHQHAARERSMDAPVTLDWTVRGHLMEQHGEAAATMLSTVCALPEIFWTQEKQKAYKIRQNLTLIVH